MSSLSKEIVEQATASQAWSLAPFDQQTAQTLQRLIQQFDAAQRLWLSGFLVGTCSTAAASVPAIPAQPAAPVVTVLYGSQSGNCERLAGQIGEALAKRAIPYVALDMLDCRKADLQQASRLLVIVSTHGEGDPPDRAAALHELLHSRKAPALKHLKYSVLALGDSSYEKFCETGRQFDRQLAALGAQALHPRVDCDVDYEQSARQWTDAVVEIIARETSDAQSPARATSERSLAPVATAYTRKNPFRAAVIVNQRLTTRDSDKDVRHIELTLEGSGIHYEPGDALGVVVRNAPETVDALLGVLPYAAEATVTVESSQRPLRDALSHADIGRVTQAFIEKYLQLVGAPAEALALPPHAQLLDLIRARAPQGLSAEEFAKLLRPLAPRLYSIASSAKATPDEVHLTVALAQFDVDGKRHYGVASRLFADASGGDASLPVYLHRNPNFRLPPDASTSIIMIGPGTGVAPFRGFLAEREAIGARGRNWLFFGDRRFRSDFLYQAEWLEYRKRKVLHRMEVAFSRDQSEKVYVQHRLAQHGAEVYAWIQEGAHVYVCGDAQHMAADVHAALLGLLRTHGGHSEDRAAEELLELQRARRYQRDVY